MPTSILGSKKKESNTDTLCLYAYWISTKHIFLQEPSKVKQSLCQGPLIISGHSHEDGAPFIPMKAVQWRMKPKWLNKNSRIFHAVGPVENAHMRHPPTEVANYKFSTGLTWMGIRSFNGVALLDYPNFIGPNRSNYDSQMTRFTGVVK